VTDPSHIYVISGLPGSGKSTLAARLARHFTSAAHVEADRLQDLIVSGAAYGGVDGLSTEAHRQLRLRIHHAVLLAKSFREAGFNAVIDDIIAGSRFDDLYSALDGVPFSFIMLLRDLDSMKSHWRALGSPFAESWDWIDYEIRHATPRVGLWVDSTSQNEDETFNEIVARLSEATVSGSDVPNELKATGI